MDKKRLRVMYASVAGVFSTVVPLLLAFNSDSQNAMHYGSFSTHPAVYAFNAESRGYEDSVKFCESLWMDIAVFHSMEELLDGMLSLTHGVDSFVGATRAPAPDGGAPNSFAWVDGTPWWQPEEDIIDWHSAQDPYMYVMNPVEGQSTVFDATFAVRKCAGDPRRDASCDEPRRAARPRRTTAAATRRRRDVCDDGGAAGTRAGRGGRIQLVVHVQDRGRSGGRPNASLTNIIQSADYLTRGGSALGH
eukprot:COSAG06_NODE_4327_length_4364_cov_2.274091_3_plen_248_part_00